MTIISNIKKSKPNDDEFMERKLLVKNVSEQGVRKPRQE